MAAIQFQNKPIKIVNLPGVKKLILYNSGDVHLLGKPPKEHHHQKANTQNLNIYNILHSNPLDSSNNSQINDKSSRSPNLSSYNTTDFSSSHEKHKSYSKPRPIESSHELALRSELELYKAEVERRFKASTTNGVYNYPRVFDDCEETADFVPEKIPENAYTKKGFQVSIYDDFFELDNTQIMIQKKPVQPSTSKNQKENTPLSRNRKRVLNTHLYNRIQKILKNETTPDEKASVVLNKTAINPVKIALNTTSESNDRESLNNTLNYMPTSIPMKSATPYNGDVSFTTTMKPKLTISKNRPIAMRMSHHKQKVSNNFPLLTSMDMINTSYFGGTSKHTRTKTNTILGTSMVLRPSKGTKVKIHGPRNNNVQFKTLSKESCRIYASSNMDHYSISKPNEKDSGRSYANSKLDYYKPIITLPTKPRENVMSGVNTSMRGKDSKNNSQLGHYKSFLK